ncbi:8526_t:CDS:2, partial [Funneliformis geosporum]
MLMARDYVIALIWKTLNIKKSNDFEVAINNLHAKDIVFADFHDSNILVIKEKYNRISTCQIDRRFLNIKVVTPLDAIIKNNDPETMEYEEVELSIETSSSIIITQRKSIEGLKNVNQMHQN